MKTKIKSLTLCLAISISALQAKEPTMAESATLNILFSGLSSGVGAMINKKKGYPVHKAFINGFWKGSIGGGVSFTGKLINKRIYSEKDLWMGWPSRIVNSVGMSITENASLGNGMFDNMHTYLYFTRLDYNVKEKSFRARALPLSMIDFTYRTVKLNTKIDFKTSMITGSIISKGCDIGYKQCVPDGFSFLQNVYRGDKLNPPYLKGDITRVYQREQMNMFTSYIPVDTKYVYIENIFSQNLMTIFLDEQLEKEVLLMK